MILMASSSESGMLWRNLGLKVFRRRPVFKERKENLLSQVEGQMGPLPMMQNRMK
jgi:hypothetical protein